MRSAGDLRGCRHAGNARSRLNCPITGGGAGDPAQRGVALLIALLILAIAAGIASSMLWARSLATYRTTELRSQRQAYLYDIGAEAWVEQILRRSAGHNDTLGSPWARHLPPLPVQGGQLQGGVEDLQGLFNLNDLIGKNGHTDSGALLVFRRLLGILGLAPQLASAVADWVDADHTVTTPGGAEAGYYATLTPPYAPANAPFVSVTTLRLVRGITPAIYARLSPYVSALPTATPVNINTAPAPVLAAVVPDLSLAQARQLVATRGLGGFNSIDQFRSLVQRKLTFPVSLKSDYFLLHVTTSIGSTQLSLYSVIYRNQQGMTKAIARSFTPP